MKKILVVCLMAILSSVIAEELETKLNYFVGVGIEQVKADVTASAGTVSLSDTLKDSAIKLKSGVIIDDAHRVSLSYVGHSENSLDLDLTLLNYDYIIPLESGFSLLIGTHIGKASYEDGLFEDTALAYGIQAGGLYDITENVSFEAGLSYTKTSLTDTATISSIPVTLESDKSTALYFSFNYKF